MAKSMLWNSSVWIEERVGHAWPDDGFEHDKSLETGPSCPCSPQLIPITGKDGLIEVWKHEVVLP